MTSIVDSFLEMANSSGAVAVEKTAELGEFLKWAHTMAPPFHPDFVASLKRLAGYAEGLRTLPADLSEGGEVIGRLDLAIMTLLEERERLLGLYTRFQACKKEIETGYSQEEAARWLETNLPAALIYASRTNLVAEPAAE